MVNSRAAAQSSPTPNPPRPKPAGEAVCALGVPELVAAPEPLPGLRAPCAPETTPCDAASTPPPGATAGASPFTPPPVGYCVGSAFASFHALIAVSRQFFANEASHSFSVSPAAASAAMAFHWKYGLLVVKIQRSSGLPE